MVGRVGELGGRWDEEGFMGSKEGGEVSVGGIQVGR